MAEFSEDVFINFKLKLKKIKLAFSKWFRDSFGKIFKRIGIKEEIVKLKENFFEECPSPTNRVVLNKATTEYYKYLKF